MTQLSLYSSPHGGGACPVRLGDEVATGGVCTEKGSTRSVPPSESPQPWERRHCDPGWKASCKFRGLPEWMAMNAKLSKRRANRTP